MLSITVENQPEGRVTVHLKGRLDTETHAQCEQQIHPLLHANTKVIVLDFSGLEYLNSMGLRVIMQTAKTMRRLGGKCLLAHLSPPIKAVIDIANALPSECVFASIQEADRYLDAIQKKAAQGNNQTEPL